MSIEQFTLELSNKLGKKLNKSKEEIEVLKYGLFITLHTTMAIILTIIIGIVTGTFLEIMLISITVALLKRYSGGIHASSPLRCVILGIIVSLILAIVCKIISGNFNFNNLVLFSIITLASSAYILYKKCPVGNKNKPLNKESIRKRLRKKAFNFMILICMLIIISLFIYKNTEIHTIKSIVIAMELGITLQVFGLTNLGSKFINSFEKVFDIIKVT